MPTWAFGNTWTPSDRLAFQELQNCLTEALTFHSSLKWHSRIKSQ